MLEIIVNKVCLEGALGFYNCSSELDFFKVKMSISMKNFIRESVTSDNRSIRICNITVLYSILVLNSKIVVI